MGNFTFVRRRESRRLVTLVLLIAFLFGLAGGLAPVRVGIAPTTPATPTLDGRIGGTVAAFKIKFGKPTNEPTDDITAKRTYKNKNYQYLTTQAIDGYVYRVIFSADHKSADPETKKTWTKSKATSIAKRFIPADAECGEASPYKGKKALRVTCTECSPDGDHVSGRLRAHGPRWRAGISLVRPDARQERRRKSHVDRGHRRSYVSGGVRGDPAGTNCHRGA